MFFVLILFWGIRSVWGISLGQSAGGIPRRVLLRGSVLCRSAGRRHTLGTENCCGDGRLLWRVSGAEGFQFRQGFKGSKGFLRVFKGF